MRGRTTLLWTLKAAAAGLIVGVTLGVATSLTTAQDSGCAQCPTPIGCWDCGFSTGPEFECWSVSDRVLCLYKADPDSLGS